VGQLSLKVKSSGMSLKGWVSTLDYSKAQRLTVQIKSEFPRLLPTVKNVGKGIYAVEIETWKIEYSKWEGMEYDEFLVWAIENGFDPDIPDSKYLFNPISVLTLITTPGQWEVLLLIAAKSEKEITERYRMPGRPANVA
jgi:hypothetical protein